LCASSKTITASALDSVEVAEVEVGAFDGAVGPQLQASTSQPVEANLNCLSKRSVIFMSG
jgi:hypothetical protein